VGRLTLAQAVSQSQAEQEKVGFGKIVQAVSRRGDEFVVPSSLGGLSLRHGQGNIIVGE
jgi:hypothetical protein